MLNLQPRHLFALISLACFGLLGGGVFLTHVMSLAACPLCILQRLLYLLIAVLAAFAALGRRPTLISRILAGICGLAALTGVLVAAYQVWIQRFAPQVSCGAARWWENIAYWAGDFWPWLFAVDGLCADPAWIFLHLSIAEWSLLCFVLLTVLLAKMALVTPHRMFRGLA